MGKGLFLTGTGTEVGKTFVTALIIKKLREAGKRAGYFKAAASGSQRTKDGVIVSADAAYVSRVSGLHGTLSEMVPYVYENEYSPHLAAQAEGNPLELSVVCSRYAAIAGQYDYVTMEGSGGIVCPLRYDSQVILLEDVIKKLGLGVLIVADAGLGTLNAVTLTVSYLYGREIPVKGVILNRYKGGVIEADNRKMVTRLTGVPVLAAVPEGAGSLDMDVAGLEGLYG